MAAPTRFLIPTLSAAALLVAPVRWAGGQTAAQDALPPHLFASPIVPFDAAASLPAGALVERGPGPSILPPAFASAVPMWSRTALAPKTDRGTPSMGRSVAWGAVVGAAVGTLTGLTVLAMCDSHCEDTRGRGLALHIGIGTVVGGAVGALVHRLRD